MVPITLKKAARKVTTKNSNSDINHNSFVKLKVGQIWVNSDIDDRMP